MNPDDSWAHFFNLPVFRDQEPPAGPSVWERMFPICPVCGATCAEIWR